MHLKHLLLALAFLTLIGCLPVSTRFVSGLTPEERAAAANLPVYEKTLAAGSYEAIGEVRGLSCQTSAKDAYRASRDNAVTELRRATVRAGGTAVMEVSCTRLERGHSRTNCFRAFECRGMAVRLEGDATMTTGR